MSGVTTNDSSVLCDVGIMMMIPGYTQGTAPQSEEAPSPEPGTQRTGLWPRLRGSDTRRSRGQFYVTLGVGCTCCLGPGFESLEIFLAELGWGWIIFQSLRDF